MYRSKGKSKRVRKITEEQAYRIRVYQDTLSFCSRNIGPPKEKSVVYPVDEGDEEWVDTIPKPETQIYFNVSVVQADTLDCAYEVKTQFPNSKIGIQSNGSEICPGGGVNSGASAQEEDICRRSTAIMTLNRKEYPLRNVLIFSPKVIVVKDSQYEYLPRSEFFEVSMITVPALRKPKLDESGKKYARDDFRIIMGRKIETIFRVAITEGVKILILGALGCGAFRNPPEEVAYLYRENLDKYRHYFEKIIFAIYVNPEKERDQHNFDVFNEVINS